MRSILSAVVLCAFTSAAIAQISFEEAERRLQQKQAVRPTTNPTTKPVVEAGPVKPELLQQALAELRAGKNKECIATATSFQSSLKRPIGKLNDPNWIDSLHIQAVAHMRLGQLEKARSLLERIGEAGQNNRSIVVNQAMIDIMQKVAAIRAVKNLKTYNATHPEDELVINLWGVALDTAASRSNLLDVDKYAEEFLKANTILERSKPGMRHWGVEWMTADRFSEIERKRNIEMRHVNSALDSLKKAQNRLQDAQARYAAANTLNAKFGRPGTTDRRRIYPGGYNEQERRRRADEADRRALNDASQDVTNAEREVSRAEESLAAARARLPKPDWTMKLEPVDPELMQASLVVVQAVSASKVDEWEKQQAEVDARSRFYEIKGTRLGMPLEMFKIKYQRGSSAGSVAGMFYSDQEPDKDNSSLLYKAEFSKFGVVHAAAADSSASAVATGGVTIAGAPVQSFVYQFIDGKLYQMTIFIDQSHYSQVMEAMKAKYGEPRHRRGAAYEDAFGGKAVGDALVWENAVSEIVVFERAGRPGAWLLLLSHKELSGVVTERMKAAKKPRTDDL